jgi:hypothetical protein
MVEVLKVQLEAMGTGYGVAVNGGDLHNIIQFIDEQPGLEQRINVAGENLKYLREMRRTKFSVSIFYD